MDRQLYGIGSLVDREKYGLGSSLKSFVRKIIPNEVSKVATTVAPFIAPFDPATAAVLSSVGTFDQTGSMGTSLKRGALTYGLGQGARYLGGADFQALPGQAGFTGESLLSPASYSQGIGAALDPRVAKGLTMPTGSQTGLKLAREVQPVPETVAGMEEVISAPVAKQTVTQNVSNIMKGENVLDNAFELVKKGAKAAFTKTDAKGNTVLDKRAVIAAVAGASSYIEARNAAKDLGVDLTEEEYDEVTKAEKLGEYQGYLQNFFSGKKDGGRIPFADGTDPMEDTGNMGVVTRGLPEAAFEQEDQSISYMDPKAKEQIFESLATMEPGSRSSIIEFMMKAGKISDDDYKEFMERLQMGVEEEETRITKDVGGGAYTPEQILKMKRILFQLDDNPDILVMDDENIVQMYMQLAETENKADGGIMGIPTGNPRMNPRGVKELDYRQEGGFVPIGIKEKADDVPAMLSKNEFVMTADAVRGIGNGSVENGAKKLYNMMKEAEKVGRGVA